MLITLLTPIIGAILILLFGQRSCIRNFITVITSIVSFGLFACFIVSDTADDIYQMPLIIPSLNLSLALSQVGMLFAFMIIILWILANIYAIGYMDAIRDDNQQRFFLFFTVSISFALGIAFSGNLLTTFIFYELLTLSTYPLIIHQKSDEAIKAGRTYLRFLLGSSLFLLFPAIIITYGVTGGGDFSAMTKVSTIITSPVFCSLLLGMFIYGIGKAALMPGHRWLTAAMVAPTPVSALLHAVAVVKSGVFIVIMINFHIFNIEWVHQQYWLICLSCFTIIMGSVYALKATKLKQMLAYSTISQLSYITLLATIADDIYAPITYMILHAFAKITLFFAAGAIYIETKIQEINKLNGIGKSMPWTMICFAISGCSMIGLPFTGLFWGKMLLLSGAAHSNLRILIITTISISTLLNTLYFFPIIYNAFCAKNSKQYHEAALTVKLPIFVTTIFNISFFWLYLL